MPITHEQPFVSPEEEIRWLRNQLEAKTHKEAPSIGGSKEYKRGAVKEILREVSVPQQAGPYALSGDDVKKKAQDLQDEPHHVQIEKLLYIAAEKGILSALDVARGLRNPHLLDDFHDRLVVELRLDEISPS
ncbi:MAG: hypothetical protein HY445_00045 [Candidatus Niyogibacteria bacterium]|nr:hypothetical protein [Candidatus Niyogibacteria bacterium]